VNAVDDATLIGLLILALNARNVSIQTRNSGNAARTKLVQSITGYSDRWCEPHSGHRSGSNQKDEPQSGRKLSKMEYRHSPKGGSLVLRHKASLK
jgi:hypothetical protein